MNNKKFQKLISTADSLFQKHGIRRTSVEEICMQARVSKTTFYKFFSNKNDIVKSILLNMKETMMNRYNEIMEMDVPYQQKVEEWIKMKTANTENVSEEFIRDIIENPDPQLAGLIRDMQNETLDITMRDFTAAQMQGYIRKDISIPFILYFLHTMNDMFKDEKLLKICESPKQLTENLMNLFFYGILSEKEKQRK